MGRVGDTLVEAQLGRGVFLTDEKRLFEVVDSRDGAVALENCRFPDEPWTWMPVQRLLQEMRLVRPENPGGCG